MKRKLSILATLTILATNTVAEPVEIRISLHDALTRALRNNPLVRIERIKTDIAETLLREHQFAYEPNVRLSYTTGANDTLGLGDLSEASLSVSARAPTGTGVEFFNRDTRSPQARASGNTHQNAVGFTVTQALLQGFGLSANLVPIHKARLDIDLRQEELAGFTQRLLLDTERAYWNLLLSREELKIFKHSLDLAERLLFEAEARLQTGGIAPIDLAVIRAERASREKQLFDAQTSYKQRILALAYLMNAPELWTAAINPTDTISLLGEADALEDHLRAAQNFRPDLRQAQLQVKKGELDLVHTKNGLLPRLDFWITLQGTSYAESFGSALLPSDPTKASVASGLTLQFPITNGAARQRHQRAMHSLEERNLSIANFTRLIEYEIRAAHLEVTRASIQVETAKIVSALQQQKMEAEAEKLRVGRSTGFALLQAQRDLISANLDEVRAKSAYSDALLSLYFRDGTLLQRRGIRGE